MTRNFLSLLLLPLFILPSLAQKMPYKIDRFGEDRKVLQRFYESSISEDGVKRLDRFYSDWVKQLDAMSFDDLERRDQVDWILLNNYLAARQYALDSATARTAEYADYLQFIPAVTELDAQRRARKKVDERAYASNVAAIRKSIKSSRQALEKRHKAAAKDAEKKDEGGDDSGAEEAPEKKEDKAPAPKKLEPWQLFEIAAKVKTSERMLNDWYNHYAQYRPGFDWWLEKPVEDAKRELSEYDKWLREKMANIKNRDEAAPFGEIIGADRLQQQLDFEMIPYTPAELIERAEKEFAWCAEQMLKASTELGFETRREGLEHVKDQFVEPGKQEDYVVQQANDAIKFCDKHDLLTIPNLCRESWRVKMVDEKGQKTLPYAAYGGLNVMVAYATGSMDHEKKMMSMRGNNLHMTRIVTAHEVIPGHHLQGFVAARNKKYRGIFRTPFYVEGWSLYWEMRLWEKDFARGPEDQIGFLFWRMHRCARIIVTLKFHTGQMTPQEMIDFLVDEVGHGRDQATAEVRRYIRGGYSPLYQAAYMLGGMQLRTLQKTLVGPDGMTEKQFHDAVLRLGPIPVEMIRASLMDDVKLTKDFKTNWKF